MQPRISEAGFTPDASAGALPSAIVRVAPPIVALSEDATLLDAVMTAALDRATVIVCPSIDRFVDQVVAAAPELALIDASAVADPAVLLDSLRAQFPQMQVLVAGPGNVQHQIRRQLADGTVFRFAHKPTSAARLKLFIDAALRARQERITAEIVGAPATPSAQGERPVISSRWVRPRTAAVLVVLAGAAAIYGSQDRHHTTPVIISIVRPAAPSPAAPVATVPGPAVASSVDEREASREEEQSAIDEATIERSRLSEQEWLAAQNTSRQAARVDQMRHATDNAAPLAQSQAAEPTLLSIDLQLPAITLVAESAAASPGDGGPAATHAATASSAVMDESLLHRVNFVAPQYPPDALRDGTTGDVEMDFTVTAMGEVTDVRITSASPAGVFDAVSIEALSRSRYEPVQHDGTAVAQRAHIRMRYEL